MKGFIKIADWFGNTSRYGYELIGATVADALSDLADIANDLALITNGTVLEATISAQATINGPVAATYNSNLSEKALVNVYTAVDKTAVIAIPAPKEAVFLAGTPVVDVNNVAVQSFIGSVAIGCTVSDGETIDQGLGVAGIKDGHWVSTARR